MEIHWQVKFVSLRAEEEYTVNIYDVSWKDQPVQLTGAANPFETKEDDSDDPFLAVREQSGYVRIVDTGEDRSGNVFNWRDLIPATDTDRPVTLTDSGGNTVWQGYIQPANFGAVLYGNPQELEFPIMCSVSLTNGIDVNYKQTGLQNFAYLLVKVIRSLPLPVRPTDFVFQGKDIADELLLKLIDWQNFLDENEDGDTEASCTMYECLEHMCRFWGWTLRTFGSTWFFMCPDDTQSMGGVCFFDMSDLITLSDGRGVWPDYDANTFTPLTIGDVFADTDNTDSQLRGPAKVFINSDPNPADEFIVNPFDSLLEEAMEEAGWLTIIRHVNYFFEMTKDILSVERKGFSFTAISGKASFNMVRKLGDAGNLIHVLAIRVSGSSNNSALASLETKYMHTFSDGFFVLHGTTYRDADEYVETYDKKNSGSREMFMALGVGTSRRNAMWWNGRAWQSSYTRFTVTIGNLKPDYFTRYWEDANSAIDTNIIVTGHMYGYLYADFFGSYEGTYGDRSFPETNGEKIFNLCDFRIEFLKDSVTTRTEHETNGSYWNDIKPKKSKDAGRYKATNNNRTRDEYSEDIMFASDNEMKPGYGVVLEENGTYLSYVGNVRPEQHKADRIANYWASSKRKIEANLLATGHGGAVGRISPRYLLTIDNTAIYPLAISRDWRDDVVHIMGVEI